MISDVTIITILYSVGYLVGPSGELDFSLVRLPAHDGELWQLSFLKQGKFGWDFLQTPVQSHLNPHHGFVSPVHDDVWYRVTICKYPLTDHSQTLTNTYSSQSPQCSFVCPAGSSGGPSYRPVWWWTSSRRWWPRPRGASPSCSAPWRRAGNWSRNPVNLRPDSELTFYLFLSLAKNVSGTQIFSAKSPERVKTLFSSEEKASLSSFQYWFKYIVIV